MRTKKWRIISQGGGLVRIGPVGGQPHAIVGGYGTEQAVRDARLIVSAINSRNGKLRFRLAAGEP